MVQNETKAKRDAGKRNSSAKSIRRKTKPSFRSRSEISSPSSRALKRGGRGAEQERAAPALSPKSPGDFDKLGRG